MPKSLLAFACILCAAVASIADAETSAESMAGPSKYLLAVKLVEVAGKKEKVLVNSHVNIEQGKPFESFDGGSKGEAPMQITWGTRIKSFVGKSEGDLIPMKLDLEVSNLVDDKELPRTRGQTVSLSTKLSANKTKTITLDDHTRCELTIHRFEFVEPASE